MFPVTSLFKTHKWRGWTMCNVLVLMWSHMLMNLGVFFFFLRYFGFFVFYCERPSLLVDFFSLKVLFSLPSIPHSPCDLELFCCFFHRIPWCVWAFRVMSNSFFLLQNVWCGRTEIWAEEMDSLLRRSDCHHLLCGAEWLRPGSSWRWRNGK